MDIASSIDFGTLNFNGRQPPPVSKQDHVIDVSRQFDLYTTISSGSVDAPPIYQKDQLSDAATPLVSPTQGNVVEKSKAAPTPRFVLTTIPKPSTGPACGEQASARQWDDVRQSLQLPGAENIPSKGNTLRSQLRSPLSTDTISVSGPGYQRALETTIECELTGASMNFTQPDASMPGRMGMVNGASTCIIRITSRRKNMGLGQVRTKRSIWAIADGGKRCIQQKSSDSPYKRLETSWVTYTFESVPLAAEFQSVLLPPWQLLRSLPTSRTVRLHNSPWARTFSPRLQLCGLENLRIFRDMSDPNALVCMIHYSPNFRPSDGEEYLVFRLYPPPRNLVRIREDGDKCVKIKGLDIRGSPAEELKKKGKAPQSRAEQLEEDAYGSHSIEKIKIEFESEKEKRQFLELTRDLQGMSSW
ncbi:MAG: hypothetical protein Q9208_008423 [Pyrenodesmia sp. 3 TL-2023]